MLDDYTITTLCKVIGGLSTTRLRADFDVNFKCGSSFNFLPVDSHSLTFRKKIIRDRQSPNTTIMFRLAFIILLLVNLTTFGQTSIQNISLTNPDLNIFYVGVDNIVEVKGLGRDTTIKIVSATGQVSKWSDKFIVRHSFATNDTLSIYVSDKLVAKKFYEIKKIGDPIVRLGNITDTTATIQEILSDKKINAVIPDCYYDHRFRVLRFSIIITNNNGVQVFQQEDIQNNELPKKVSKLISKLHSGDKIKLTEITATCRDCALRRLDDITLTIK